VEVSKTDYPKQDYLVQSKTFKFCVTELHNALDIFTTSCL